MYERPTTLEGDPPGGEFGGSFYETLDFKNVAGVPKKSVQKFPIFRN